MADANCESFMSPGRWTIVASFCSKLTDTDTTPFNAPILPNNRSFVVS